MTRPLAAIRSGHWPSLLGAWLHFEVSFMVWILIGALGVSIADQFYLSPTQKGLLVAVPLLTGALMRIFVGACSDQFGAKVTGLALLAAEIGALIWGWLGVHSYSDILGVGLCLGVAGASFAVALPLASRVYPPAHQGLAMGVAASANSGTVLAVFFAPRLSEAVGWQAVFGLMLIPVGIVFALFASLVRPDAGQGRQESDAWRWLNPVRDLLRQRATYGLCGLYAVTFGGFVGLCSFLPIFFHDQYGLNPVTAGSITALCGLAGSAARPFGGYAADRLGGLGVAPWIFPVIVVFAAGVAMLPSTPAAVGLMVAAVATMGFGNGVIFQIVSERFQKQMGVASGLIGAAGGLGGFFLPFCLGTLKDLTGTYGTGFLVFAGMAAVAGLSALLMRRRAGNLPGFAVDR